jgi:hypothetical protein
LQRPIEPPRHPSAALTSSINPIAPTACQVPKGGAGYTTRKSVGVEKRGQVADDSSDGSVVDNEEFPSPPCVNDKQPASALTISNNSDREPSPSPPPKCQRKAKRFYGDNSTDDGLDSPLSLSHTSHAKAKSRAAESEDDFGDYFDNDNDKIGDPFDVPDADDVEAIAINRLTSTKNPYKKLEKQIIFKGALTLKKSSLLGPDPPQYIKDIYDMWHISTSSFKSWDVATIARPILLLGKHVYGLQKAGTLPTSAQAAQSLITFYRHFHSVASWEVMAREARVAREARNRKILSTTASASTKTNRGNTIQHIDPITVHHSLDFKKCPGLLY